jgi:hypothetical protein
MGKKKNNRFKVRAADLTAEGPALMGEKNKSH